MGVRKQLDRFIKRSYWLTCLYYAWDDWRTGRRFSFGNLESHSGTLHASLDLDESVRYIETVFADYLQYSGISAFTGKAAEIGPGDNCGVGLLLLDGGCHAVELVDRFHAYRDPVRQAAIYRKLAERHPSVARMLEGANFEDEGTFPGVKRQYGEKASAECFFNEGQAFDVILSRAVLEHVQDPLLALQRMVVALKPGGHLLHKVDLRDHGMFSIDHDELKWLEVPNQLYRRMSRNSGRPNRVLIHQYRSILENLPLDSELRITRLAGVGDIDPHLPYEDIPVQLRKRSVEFIASRRDRFSRELRSVLLEDLSVAGFFLVGRKYS